jgi:hypothetical protein
MITPTYAAAMYLSSYSAGGNVWIIQQMLDECDRMSPVTEDVCVFYMNLFSVYYKHTHYSCYSPHVKEL